jgi:hypothetical protein
MDQKKPFTNLAADIYEVVMREDYFSSKEAAP